jgi:GAF domain-containing protein
VSLTNSVERAQRSDRPDPLLRIRGGTDVLVDLFNGCAADDPVDEVLGKMAEGAVRATRDACAGTITLLTGHVPDMVACSDPQCLDLDQPQFAAGRGPSLEAARSRRTVRAGARDDRWCWPEFAAAAERRGVTAYLSVPLSAAGAESELVGSLTVYSRSTGSFDCFDEALTRLFSTAAAHVISDARRCQQLREETRNLHIALDSRAEIDQAKGILMAVHGCTAEQAFARLASLSQQRNVKVKELARDFLRSVAQTCEVSPGTDRFDQPA